MGVATDTPDGSAVPAGGASAFSFAAMAAAASLLLRTFSSESVDEPIGRGAGGGGTEVGGAKGLYASVGGSGT